jgi:hypothetical protein
MLFDVMTGKSAVVGLFSEAYQAWEVVERN